MKETKTFNMRSLVRLVTKETGLSDPGEIAKAVDARIPDELVREALRQTLRLFVRQVNTENRLPLHYDRVPASYDKQGKPRPLQQVNVAAMKRDRIRADWFARAEQAKVQGVNGWKSLLDCTRDDLVHAATFREKQGHMNLAKAQQYRDLEATLNDYGVQTVRDLPRDVLELAVGQAA
jgi:hypothetical protein